MYYSSPQGIVFETAYRALESGQWLDHKGRAGRGVLRGKGIVKWLVAYVLGGRNEDEMQWW
jgi:hypothetical protein